jgi:diguanylate cyclase (GGDEF)-like protein
VRKTADADDKAAARAARKLTRLQRSITAARLVEANEQLVLAALRAQADAHAATQALRDLSRSTGLDALTSLPNRVLLLDRFAQAIAVARRHRGRLALLFLDLDNFKQINDTLGHAAGDQVLKRVAQCLASAVRDADTVSRYGGDEFVVLLAEVARPSDAALIADKLLAALGVPTRLGDHVLRLAASIGISIYPEDGEDADTLIDRADRAMFRAKRQGLGSFAFHGNPSAAETTVSDGGIGIHGGQVVARSGGSGVGSRFVVALPLAGRPPAV